MLQRMIRMWGWRLAILGAIMLLAMMIGACGSVRRSEPIMGPMTYADPKVGRGHLLFMEHCQKCHPGGEGGLAPPLNDKPAPKFLIKTQVRLGLGAMPSFDQNQITQAELDDLADYVVALRRHDRSDRIARLTGR